MVVLGEDTVIPSRVHNHLFQEADPVLHPVRAAPLQSCLDFRGNYRETENLGMGVWQAPTGLGSVVLDQLHVFGCRKSRHLDENAGALWPKHQNIE